MAYLMYIKATIYSFKNFRVFQWIIAKAIIANNKIQVKIEDTKNNR